MKKALILFVIMVSVLMTGCICEKEVICDEEWFNRNEFACWAICEEMVDPEEHWDITCNGDHGGCYCCQFGNCRHSGYTFD